jgi:colanic acid biosynthesis glycosyl transferase WcaI
MRILIISQYFWPEYFRINDLATDLSKTYEVDVLTGYPNYPKGEIYNDFTLNKNNYDRLDKIRIYRTPIYPRKSGKNLDLVLNYFSFLISSIIIGTFLLRKKQYDFVVTFASSPVTVSLIGIYFSKLKKSKHFIWLLDLWPNVLHDLKIINNKLILYKIFKVLVNYIYKKADILLCQSLTFKKIINNSTGHKYKDKLVYFPSWPEEIKDKDSNYVEYDRNYKNIFFAGNIGDSQNFDLIVKLFENFKIKKSKIRLYVAGEGRGAFSLRNKINKLNLENIILLGWINFDKIQDYFNNSDYLLLSLKYHETFNATIPGKFQTYLKYKKPILGFIGGETNYIINKYKIGKAFDYSDDNVFIKEVTNFFDKEFKPKIVNFDRLLNIFSKKKRLSKLFFYLNKWLDLEIKIKIILDSSFINYDKNFIICAFNLAFLGYYSKGDIPINKYLYLWPDGYFRKRIAKKTIDKIPGRIFVTNLLLNNPYIKKIIVLGNLSNNSQKYLENLYKLKVVLIKLPFGDLNSFKNYVPFFEKDQVCLITLPSPKQEILANYIAKNQRFFKIFCVGAALSMASGDEKPVPIIFNKIFFAEALWRLQYEPKRRIKRLFETFIYYLKGEMLNKYAKFKAEIIHEKF